MKTLASPGEQEAERAGFMAWLDELWCDVAVRAVAHELSADWHRRRRTGVGLAATMASAAVGTAMFAAAGKGFNLAAVAPPWQALPYVVAFLAILAPVLTAVQANLGDAEQAEAHRKISASYFRLKQRLDLWRIDARPSELPSKDQRAYVTQEREELFRSSAAPARWALRGAERRLRNELKERMHDRKSLAALDDELAAWLFDWNLSRAGGVASSLWLPASYVAAAIYMARSPQPLGDRIGVLLIVGGIAALLGAVWKAPIAEPRKPHWLHRCLPSQVGFGVLLILLGNLLLFPSSEMEACIVLWIVLDLSWRRQWSVPTPLPREHEREAPSTGLWTASLETSSERR